MIFTSNLDETGLTIQAHPENKAEWHGYRFEGACPPIQLINPIVKFEYPIKSIHPDLLGLLCMLSFFPFCKDKITFPKPVSKYFQEAFSESILRPHEKIQGVFQPSGSFIISNIDKALPKYSGSEYAISFGGGIDSMAAHVLYPEAIMIHELSRNCQGQVIIDRSSDYIYELQEKGKKAYSVVNNNRRGITDPSGWTTWASSVACAVLLSTDLDIGYIMTGTTSDTLFLANGKGYREAHKPGKMNPWNRAFNHIGLKLFSPVWSMTEAGTMKICHVTGLLSKTVSCQKNEGGECHRCFKCFRKDTLAHALQYKQQDISYWKRYKKIKIQKRLRKQPLYFAHIYKFSLGKLSHIKWLNGIVEHIPDSSAFLTKYYEPGISMMAPEELQKELRNKISHYLEPLENDESLRNWKQPVNPRNVKNETLIEKIYNLKEKLIG